MPPLETVGRNLASAASFRTPRPALMGSGFEPLHLRIASPRLSGLRDGLDVRFSSEARSGLRG
jgi:hypothetical protein